MPSSLSADLVFDTVYPPQLQTRNNKNEESCLSLS